MPSFKHLPTDLQLLIVDFLTIDDCYALQEVDTDLFNVLKTRDSFWAKKVFEKHIQFPTKSINLFKCSESPVPYYVPTLLEFNNFKDAKVLWDRLLQSQKGLNNALKFLGMGSEQGQLLSQRLYSILVNPTAPLPSFKRENQYLQTSSSFENFLTEIHFDVNPPASLYDVNFVSLEAACQTIQSKVHKVQRRPNKVIRSQKKGQNKPINSRQDRIKMAVKRKSENRIERVFASVQDFIKDHCVIVRNYLLSLTSGRIILKEYRRFWKEFTFSMIEMTKVLKPFEGLLTVNQANFSIWKVMVQIWLEEVYEKVALKIKTSFQTLLMDTIVQEIVNNGISTANMGQALYGSVYKRKFLKDQERRDQEKVMNLLLKSFIAISDISLYKNDQSLESIAFSQFQPKSRLISFIYPKIKSFIETTMIALNGEPNKLITALNVVKSVIDTVFNEEVSLEEIPDTFIEHKDVTCGEEDPENLKEIAGQYKIVSKCKWNTRLSDVYQSLMEVPTFC